MPFFFLALIKWIYCFAPALLPVFWILQISFLIRSGTSWLLIRSLKANQMQVKGQGGKKDANKHTDQSGQRRHMYVCVCRLKERERKSATGFLSDVFLMAKEMFWNLKRFRRITGTPLSILDNYSVRPTSEGQITSVWGKKKPECVKNRKWCLTQTFASGFPQSQGLYLLRGCFEGPGDGGLGSWLWTWPDPDLELHLGLDWEKRPTQTFIQTTEFCSSRSPLWPRFGCFFPQIIALLGVLICFTQVFVLACPLDQAVPQKPSLCPSISVGNTTFPTFRIS